MEIDLDWPETLHHRVGAEERLCKIDVFHDFAWQSRFRDGRTQFKNGKSLATLVIDRCPVDKTPALLLTGRDDVRQGPQQTARFFVFVVNIDEYRAAEGDAAVSYLANHLDVDITDIEQLRDIADAADPNLVRTFIESSLDIGLIADWVLDNPERMDQLREPAGDDPAETPPLAEALASISALSHPDFEALAGFLGHIDQAQQRATRTAWACGTRLRGCSGAVSAGHSLRCVGSRRHRAEPPPRGRREVQVAAYERRGIRASQGRSRRQARGRVANAPRKQPMDSWRRAERAIPHFLEPSQARAGRFRVLGRWSWQEN